MTEITPIHNCRICQSSELSEVVNLGTQSLTGVFPKSNDETVMSGPIVVVW